MSLSEEFNKREPSEHETESNERPFPRQYHNMLEITLNADGEILAVATKDGHTWLLRFDKKWNHWVEARTANEGEIDLYDKLFLQRMNITNYDSDDQRTEWVKPTPKRFRND